MIGSSEVLSAIRELSNTKQLARGELHGLLEDGIKAALAIQNAQLKDLALHFLQPRFLSVTEPTQLL